MDGGEQAQEVLFRVDVLLTVGGQQNVLVLFQPQTLQHVAFLDFFQIHVQHFCHGRAGLVGALLGQAGICQILPGELGIAHIHVGDHIHDTAIGLLGQALVLAAVACLHVKQRDVQPLRRDGGQAGVGIAQHQIALRLQFGQKLIAATQNITAGHAQILTNHGHQNVRAILPEGVFQLEILPEHGGEVSVPVLIVIDHAAVKIFPAALDDSCQTNNLRTGAAANHDLGASVVFPFKIVFHKNLLLTTSILLLHRLEEGVRVVRVKNLVASHHRHQILRLRQVDDVVGPAGNHVDSLNLVPGNFKLHRFPGVDVPLLDQAMTSNHNEKLPLGVVPVLPFGNAGLRDIDAYLSAVGGMDQLGEGATVVHVHLQGILELVRGQIGQIQGIQFLCKGAVRHLRHHERGRLRLELLQQIHDFAQRDLVSHRNTAVATISLQNSLHAVKFTVLLLAFQQVKHSLYQIVDVQQFQLGTAVVDGERFIVGNRPAEGTDGTVVFRAAVSHQVDEAIDRHLCPGLPSILEEQLLASFLATTILAVAKTACKGGLNGGRQHDGCLIVVLFQAVQQVGCKAEVALHEILRVFRTIHTSQIEHEVCLTAVLIQLLRGGVQVILVDFFNIQCRAGLIFPLPDVFQVVAQGGSHHALGTCD